MDSFEVVQGFRFRHSSPEPMREAEADVDEEGGRFSGVLEVYVHHARNIHNICIYDDQDVYAKLSLTCRPDEVASTRVARGGGRNPDFHESLRIRVARPDAVLKCEIWMLSRARNYLEDQLLGFALVPLSSLSGGAAGEGKTTQDFTLSSTDLFHTPAGTVRLTLHLSTSPTADPSEEAFAAAPGSSIASEVVLLDPGEYGRIEFPDIGAARENQRMVSHYISLVEEHGSPSNPAGAAGFPGAGVPFLQLGDASWSMEDYEMAANSSEDNNGESASPDGCSIQNSGVFGSTTTSLSEDRNSAEDSAEKKTSGFANGSQPVATRSSETPPGTPTSKAAGADGGNGESRAAMSEVDDRGDNSRSAGAGAAMEEEEMASVFKSPLGSINLEEEQSAMQQQIVDMYMRSMQQFTESLARMKLPMDLDRPKKAGGGDVIQTRSSNLDEEGKKKDGSRVFYGSRAFF